MTTYLPEVIGARRLDGFVIDVRFNDGTEKHIDISRWFNNPAFKALENPYVFAEFFIEGGTLAWSNGVDIAPESLYDAIDVRTLLK